jgi:hypothetical protein
VCSNYPCVSISSQRIYDNDSFQSNRYVAEPEPDDDPVFMLNGLVVVSRICVRVDCDICGS